MRVLDGRFLCLLMLDRLIVRSRAFAVPPPPASSLNAPSALWASRPIEDGNILILDHVNINHEKGRHDWLLAFYRDFLGCALDPRKADNVAAGAGTVWANLGAQQLHLPEGRPAAQVLEGLLTLAYEDPVGTVWPRRDAAAAALRGSRFDVQVVPATSTTDKEDLLVTDPWGTRFRLVAGPASERDPRGRQPGAPSEGLALRDVTIYINVGANLPGIGRFYQQILGAPLLESTKESVKVVVGPGQTLTFEPHPEGRIEVRHDDLVEPAEPPPDGHPSYPSNYGPHISMYVADLSGTYRRVQALGALYVNPRFKRQAYSLEEAVDDCMFRCLDIVDPDDAEAGPILRLEHEIRSVVKRDGSKYKSCPFEEIPAACLRSSSR